MVVFVLLVVGLCLSGCTGCGCRSIKPSELGELKPCDFRLLKPVEISGHTWTGWETKNDGPLVVLFHEVTGLSQSSLHLAKALSECDEHYHVIMPLLFGDFGDHRPTYQLFASAVRSVGSRWDLFSADSLGSITREAVEFCAAISRRNEGRSMVVIGNCISGSWPVALLREPFVCGGIICQPALPMVTCNAKRRQSLGISDEELQIIASVVKDQHKPVLGIRYLHDKFVTEALPLRFDHLRHIFGGEFDDVVLATKAEKAAVRPPSKWIEAHSSTGHSTLTENAGLKDRIERGALLKSAEDLLKRAHRL